jgi:hypothetical protein
MAFLNWVRLVIFVFFKKERLATEAQRHREKTEGRVPVGFWKEIGDGDTPSFPFGRWGFFDGNIDG